MKLRPWHTDRALIEAAAATFSESGASGIRTLPELLDLIEARTGVPVQVKEHDDPELETFAALFQLPTRSLMVLRKADRSYRKMRGLFHECGHLLFGHDECVVFSELPIGKSPNTSHAPLERDGRRAKCEAQAEALAIMIERQLSRPGFYRDEQAF